MTNKDKVVTVESSKLEQKHEFMRVDFTNPQTVLRYGHDILERMAKIVDDVSGKLYPDDLTSIDFYTKVDKLSGFVKQLDELETKGNKPGNTLDKLVSRIFRNSTKSQRLFHATEYNKYHGNIEALIAYMTDMYSGLQDDFRLYDQFIKDIKPFFEILGEVFSLGLDDMNNDNLREQALESEMTINSNDIDIKREATIAGRLIAVLDDRLISIEKARASVDAIVIQWNLRRVNILKLLNNYNDMIELINDINAIDKNFSISASAIQLLNQKIREGIDMFKQGETEKRTFRVECTRILGILVANYKLFSDELKELVIAEAQGAYLVDNSNNLSQTALVNVSVSEEPVAGSPKGK